MLKMDRTDGLSLNYLRSIGPFYVWNVNNKIIHYLLIFRFITYQLCDGIKGKNAFRKNCKG